MKLQSTPEAQAMKDFKDGVDFDDCPYPPGSKERSRYQWKRQELSLQELELAREKMRSLY